jgi:hypothetical protein
MRVALSAVLLAAVSALGCGGDDATSSSTTAATSSSGAGGQGGQGGGEGGAGGQGGAGGGAADSGHSATETVSAGQVSSSSKYKMVFTFGQPTQNQGKTTSSKYRLQGGLAGANGSVQ